MERISSKRPSIILSEKKKNITPNKTPQRSDKSDEENDTSLYV